MTENNDKLLESFFAGQRQEVADRSNRLARLWTAGGFTLAAVLFVLLDGVQLVWDTLRETFTTTLENGMAQTDPKSLALAVVVLLFLMYKKIASLA